MTFIEYVIFMTLGMIIGAFLGRLVMRSLWGTNAAAKKTWIQIAFATVGVWMSAR